MAVCTTSETGDPSAEEPAVWGPVANFAHTAAVTHFGRRSRSRVAVVVPLPRRSPELLAEAGEGQGHRPLLPA
jgi:hypothetical protein